MPRRILRFALVPLAALLFHARAGADDDPTQRLIQAALADEVAYERLEQLCDRVGCRLSGTPALARAVAWAAEAMRADGLSEVRLQKVMVPAWVRGRESAELLEPAPHRLTLLGLGGSVGTPPEGVEGEVLVVRNFEELKQAGEKVKGRMVLYDAPFTNYGETVAYRVRGASEAAKLGAVAVLVRSVTPVSFSSPHTGMLRYADDAPRIPAAAVTIEDAERMQRIADRGSVLRARLKMEAHSDPDVESANVIGEVPGRTDEIVLLGAHLDSWDVGAGATDDGGGVVTVMAVARLMVKLGLRPRRTIRVVLFVNEENGLKGAEGYRAAIGDEIRKHVAAIETDSGLDAPVGFGLSITDKAREERGLGALVEIARVLEPLGAARIKGDGGGADIGPLGKDGVPVMGLDTDLATYWNFHHTNADTFDKVDPAKLKKHMAVLAAMAWALAEREARLGD